MVPGTVRVSQGFFQLQQTCPRCRGTGKIIRNPCETCHGQGRVRRPRSCRSRFLRVSTPATASACLAKAKPGAMAGRPVTCTSKYVRPHEIFEREGEHLSCEVPVSFVTAALGGTVMVPTLEGQVSLKIPPETQSGRVFRLRDKGVKPVRGGNRGDLFCKVMVETPVNLSGEQKDLLRRFEESLKTDHRRHAPREEGFFEGVKRFFTSAE